MRTPIRRALAVAVVAAFLASMLAAALPASAAPATKGSAPADSVVVQFADRSASEADVAGLARAGVERSRAQTRGRGRVRVKLRAGEDASSLAQRLRRQPGVKWAAPNITMRKTALPTPPNDTYYSGAFGTFPPQRHYLGPTASFPYSIDLEPAWQQAFSSAEKGLDLSRPGVTMALIDTGYTASSMETSGGVFVPVRNFINGSTNTADDDGHGSMVGSIMHAKAGNGYGIAGVSYASPAKVLVFKALDANGAGNMDDVMTAVEMAADRGAKVINLSLGGSGLDEYGWPIPGVQTAWDATVAYAAARGAVVVAASGNDGTRDVFFPASANGAIAVGSVDPTDGTRSYFSNYGPQISLVAPGERVLVVSRTGVISAGAGTSFAAPLASASISLLWSVLPKASAASITSAVTGTAKDLGAVGRDELYGYGELDVWAAYQRLMATFPTQPAPSISASGTPGFTTTLKWPALPGSDVIYRYGLVGGPTYTTTVPHGDVWVGADGTYTAWAEASASDMFSSARSTFTFDVSTGRPAITLQRYAGPDRYATASAVSRSGFPATAPVVVLATGENFPDALSAGVLAHRSGGPLLLTRQGFLPQPTADEIARLQPSRVIIVGGRPAVSDAVANAVAGPGRSVTRIEGGDRYETAEKVASAVAALASTPPTTVVVASGENFPDALSASPMAAAAGYPVLLTRKASLPVPTARALANLGTTRALVVGGEPAISAAVAAQLPSAERIFGADRYATSRAIADYAVGSGILTHTDIGIATGRSFPDALAGGVLMARLGGPMVLGDSANAGLDAWLAGIGDECLRVDAFGSELVVPAPFAEHVLTRLRR